MYFYISLAFFENITCKSIDKTCYPFPDRQNKDQDINEIVFSVKLKERCHYKANFVYNEINNIKCNKIYNKI